MNEDTKPKAGNDEPVPIPQRLSAMLYDFLGEDWRTTIELHLRADGLYWLVYLAWKGLEAERQQLKRKPPSERSATDAASVASWELDLDMLLKRINISLTLAKAGKVGK